MKNTTRAFITCFFAMVSSACLAYAAADGGQTTAEILKLVPDAQTVAMGGNSVAVYAGRPSACFNNPAALSGVDRYMFSFFQAAYPAGLNYNYAGFAMPTPYGNVSVAFGILNYTGVDSYNSDFTKLILDDSYDALITVGYALPIIKKNPYYKDYGTLGINIKLLESKLAYYNSEAFIIDMGGIYNTPFIEGLTAGAALKNIGSEMKYVKTSNPIPASFNVGLAYDTSEFEKMTLTADYCMPNNGKPYYSGGLSLTPVYFLKLNAGYKQSQDSLFTGLSTGLGLEFGHFKLDYALLPANDTGPVHFISFSFDIGSIVKMRSASDYYLSRHFREAVDMYHKGDYIESRRKFEEILSVYPGHAPSTAYLEKVAEKMEQDDERKNRKINYYMQKADYAIESKDFISAKRYYNYVVSLNPNDEEIRVGIERIWRCIEDARLEEMRSQYSAEIETYWKKAAESYKMGDYVEAKDYYNKILDLDPSNQNAKNAAIEMDSQLTRIAVGETNDLFTRGMGLYNEGKFKEALPYFEAVMMSAPNRSDVKELAEKCRQTVIDAENKKKAQQLALDQEANRPELERTYEKALSYYQRGNHLAALEQFNKCEEIAVKYQFTKYIENTKKYKALSRSALSDRHFKSGFEAFRDNKPEAAIIEYRKAISYNPDNLAARTEIEKINRDLGRAYYEKGMDYFSRSEVDKAREMFQKALEYEPDRQESIKALERTK